MRVALVLAAGASRRFGRRDKLREKLGQRTLLECAVARAREAGCARVLLVEKSPFALSLSKGCPSSGLRKGEGQCFDRLSTSGIGVVRSRDADAGLGASLAAGLGALRPVEHEVLVFLADMPFAVAPRMRVTAGIDAVRPGVKGHPMLVRTEVARRLVKVGDKGLAASLARDRVRIVRAREGNSIDIDTPAALRRVRHRIAGAQGAFRLCNGERRCSKPHNGSRLPRR